MYQVYRANMNSHYVGYELFGFDILVRFRANLIKGQDACLVLSKHLKLITRLSLVSFGFLKKLD